MSAQTISTTQGTSDPPLLSGRTIRLTKKTLEELLLLPFPTGKTQVEITDSQCTWLKVLISKAKKVTFHARFHYKHRRYSQRLGDLYSMSLDTARKDATAYRMSVLNGEVFVSSKDQMITFAESLYRYAEHSKATKKSFRSDISKISTHLIPFFKKRVRLKNMTELDMQRYLNHLEQKGLSKSTQDRHIALLKAAANFFVAQGWIPTSFMGNIKMNRPKNQRIRYLTEEELGRFIRACRSFVGDPYRAFEFIASLGLRISEALNARLEHWDKASNTLYLPDSKTGERYITLNSSAIAILEHQAQKYGDIGFVFQGRHTDRPMARPVNAWKNVLDKAGLNDGSVTPHVLRHTFSSHLLMNGVDQLTLSKLMGLSSTHCIQHHYGHLSNEHLAKANAVATDVINQSIEKVQNNEAA